MSYDTEEAEAREVAEAIDERLVPLGHVFTKVACMEYRIREFCLTEEEAVWVVATVRLMRAVAVYEIICVGDLELCMFEDGERVSLERKSRGSEIHLQLSHINNLEVRLKE